MKRALALLLGVALLAGCAGAEVAPAPTTGDGQIFTGTPDEFAALHRACLEDAGFETQDGASADGFLVARGSGSSQDLSDASEKCRAELGTPQITGLSEAELRQRYDVRVDQFTCLRAEGLTTDEAKTFEVFVDEYNRSGQQTLWEPTDGLPTVERNGVQLGGTDLCPRAGTAW